MNRSEKEKVVSQFKDIFSSSEIIIAMHYEGLDSVAISALRKESYDNKVSFKVTKNRLIKLAIEKTPYENILKYFKGPTAIAYSQDIVAASKVINNFSKSNEKLSIIGGSLKDKLIDISRIKDLASLPSLEEIRTKIAAMLATPATRIVTVVSAPGTQLARVINAYSSTEPAEDVKVEEKPAEEVQAEEKPAEEVQAEEKPAEDVKVEEKPAEEVQTEEKPAEDVQINENNNLNK